MSESSEKQLDKVREDFRANVGFTSRIWNEAGNRSAATDYTKYKGMSAEEIYDSLYAELFPLDAIVKATG